MSDVRLFQDIDGHFHCIDDVYGVCFNMLDRYWAVMTNGVKHNISRDTYNTLNAVYDVNNKAKRNIIK